MAGSRDNWADKSATFRCETCSFFMPKEAAIDVDAGSTIKAIGRCRRHAPGHSGTGWPVVFLTDWCGDHKLGRHP